MLRSLFSSRKDVGPSSGISSRHRDSNPGMGRKKKQSDADQIKRQEIEEEMERRKGAIVKDTSVTSMKHNFSEEEESLASKLERHRAGQLFKYAVISTPPPPDRSSILSKVRNYKPKSDIVQSSLDDLPAINLIDNFTEFRMSAAIGNSVIKNLPPYTIITDVLVHYMPMDTFFAVSHPLQIQINDFRKNEGTTVRHYELTDKGAYNILFCLDYSTMTSDLDDLSLSFSCNANDFKKGKAWAAVKVIVRMMHTSFPQKSNLQETMGVTLWAHSDLEDYVTDPTSMDGLITGEALKLLKESYRRGDIEDLVTPRDNKKQLNVARTVVGESGGGLHPDLLMDTMKEQALQMERKKNVQVDNVVNIGPLRAPNQQAIPSKSAMKKPNPLAAGRAMIDEDDDEGSVDPKDSYSAAGSSNETEELPVRPERLSNLVHQKFEDVI